MRKILYLLSKAPDRSSEELLVSPSHEHDVSVVLIQEAISLPSMKAKANRVYALSGDVRSGNVPSPFPRISQEDLLRMMFEADTVVAL
jgi:sulfur transfer complex TusBCD TusB component (DsrH family)